MGVALSKVSRGGPRMHNSDRIHQKSSALYDPASDNKKCPLYRKNLDSYVNEEVHFPRTDNSD